MTTVQIPTKDVKRLESTAKKLGVSRVTMIRWAVAAYDLSSLSNGSIRSTVANTVSPPSEHEQVPA